MITQRGSMVTLHKNNPMLGIDCVSQATLSLDAHKKKGYIIKLKTKISRRVEVADE